MPISDNESFQEAAKYAEPLAALARMRVFIRVFGKPGRQIAEALDGAPELAGQLDELRTLPDRFNGLFLDRGWMAFELLNVDLMKKAIAVAEVDGIDAAEQVLVDHIDSETLRFHLRSMAAVKAYRPRAEIIDLARIDYLEERYHAAVPVVLAQIDGILLDLTSESFYRKKKTRPLVAWDSISAHPEALPKIVELFGESRNQTSQSAIDIPFRNGILHGRDLGYANKKVAAKCWWTLFSLRDWATKAEQGRLEQPPVEPQPSIKELMARIMENARQKKAIENWRPREAIQLPDDWKELSDDSPERAVAEFAQAWLDRDFDRMASHTQQTMKALRKDMASHLADAFGLKTLESFRLVSSEDVGAAMSTVRVQLKYQVGDLPPVHKVMISNVIYEGAEGGPLVRSTPGGTWGVNDVSALREEELSPEQADSI